MSSSPPPHRDSNFDSFMRGKYRQYSSRGKYNFRGKRHKNYRSSESKYRSSRTPSRSRSRSPSRSYNDVRSRRRSSSTSTSSSDRERARPRYRRDRSYTHSRSPKRTGESGSATDIQERSQSSTNISSRMGTSDYPGKSAEMSDHAKIQIGSNCSSSKQNLRITIDNEHFESQPQFKPRTQETSNFWRTEGSTEMIPKNMGSRDMGQFDNEANTSRYSSRISSQTHVKNAAILFPIIKEILEGSSRSTTPILPVQSSTGSVVVPDGPGNESWKQVALPFMENVCSSLDLNSAFEAPHFDELGPKSSIADNASKERFIRNTTVHNRKPSSFEPRRSASPLPLIPGLGDLEMSNNSGSDDVDKYLYGEDASTVSTSSVSQSMATSCSFNNNNNLQTSLKKFGIDIKNASEMFDLSEGTIKRGEEVVRKVNDMIKISPADPRLKRRASITGVDNESQVLPAQDKAAQYVHTSSTISAGALPTAAPCILSDSQPLYIGQLPPNSTKTSAQDMPLPVFGQNRDFNTFNESFNKRGRYLSSNLITLVGEKRNLVQLDQKSNVTEVQLLTEVKPATSTSSSECRPIVNSKEKEHALSLIQMRNDKINELKKRLADLKTKETDLTRKSQRRRDGQIDPELAGNNQEQEMLQKEITFTEKSVKAMKEKIIKYDIDKALRTSQTTAKNPVITGRHAAKSGPAAAIVKPSPPSPQIQYRYVDYGSHWCKYCSDVFPHAADFLKHLHRRHLNVMENVLPTDRPWVVKPKTIANAGTIQPSPIKGVEFMLPSMALFCKLCKEFYGDIVAAQVHLESENHHVNYKKFVFANPHYEKKLESERNICLSKKKDDIRLQLEHTMKDAFQSDVIFVSQSTDSQNSQIDNEKRETDRVASVLTSNVKSSVKNQKLVKKNNYLVPNNEALDDCHIITKPGAKIPIKLKDKGVSSSVIKEAAKSLELNKVAQKARTPPLESPTKFNKKVILLRPPVSRGLPPPLEEFITIGESSTSLTCEEDTTPPLRITPQIGLNPSPTLATTEPKRMKLDTSNVNDRAQADTLSSSTETLIIEGPQPQPTTLNSEANKKISELESDKLHCEGLEIGDREPSPESLPIEEQMQVESCSDDKDNSWNIKIVSVESVVEGSFSLEGKENVGIGSKLENNILAANCSSESDYQEIAESSANSRGSDLNVKLRDVDNSIVATVKLSSSKRTHETVHSNNNSLPV